MDSLENKNLSREGIIVRLAELNLQEEPVERKPVGFIAVSIGEGINDMFKELGVDYIIKGGQFHKMKIKIIEKGRNIYVNSYYDRNTNMWYNAYNTNAQPTTQYDPDVIYNNFDFKVNISGLGNVYF